MRWRSSAAFLALLLIVILALPGSALAQRPRGGGGGGGAPSGSQPTAGQRSGGPPPSAGQPSGGHAVYRTGGYYGGRHYGGGHYGGYYRGYYPYYGYYGSFYGPWYGFGWWGAYPWYGYGAPVYYADGSSGVRLQVTPREAEVYVDGSLAGIVDDFDGTFQRLNLPPGEHEIEIYLQGYRSVRQQILLTPGRTYRIKHVMQPLAPGEAQDPRPVPAPAPPPSAQAPAAPYGGPAPGPAGRPRPGPDWTAAGPQAVNSNFGSLSVRVQPPGADVFVDGERWQGPDGQQRLVVEVAEGVHRVEIRKDGYQSFTADVTVRRGEVTPLNVSLLAREN